MTTTSSATRAQRKGMRWIPGGTFAMGSEDHYPEEAPVREATVGGLLARRAPGDQSRVHAIRQGDRARDGGRGRARSRPVSRRATRAPLRRLGRVSALDGPGRPERPLPVVVVAAAEPTGAIRKGRRARCTGANGIPWCTSPTPTPTRTQPGRERSCRARRNGSSRRAEASTASSSPGGTSISEGTTTGQHLAGRVPVREHAAGRLRGHVAGRAVSAERLRAPGHDRRTSGSGRRTGTRPATSLVAVLRRRSARRRASIRTTRPRSRARS